MQDFWMRVGVVMERWERDVQSQGSVSRVAKVVLSCGSVDAWTVSGAPFEVLLGGMAVADSLAVALGLILEPADASKFLSSEPDIDAPESES